MHVTKIVTYSKASNTWTHSVIYEGRSCDSDRQGCRVLANQSESRFKTRVGSSNR